MEGVPAATGVSDHYGHAVLVTVALEAGAPAIIDRRDAVLRDPALPGSPYHHETRGMLAAQADALLRTVRASVDRLADAALESLMDDLGPVRHLGLTMRPAPLPHLPLTAAEAHADYTVMCAADGMLYHHAVAQAARRLNLPVRFHRRRREIEDAAQAAGTSLQAVQDWLTREGRRLGPPWRADEKAAAASAWAMLAALR
jgi:hypothetical protein